MAHFVMADDAIAFSGREAEAVTRDIGAVALVGLAEALAARGHRVQVFTKDSRELVQNGVAWAPLHGALPRTADLFIANRSHKLLKLVRRASRTALWIHESGRRLFRWGRLTAFARRRPVMVFLGVYHAATYPGWAPGGRRAIIPLATAATFRKAATALRPPPPFAIHTGASSRSLDWVLDTWSQHVHPALPKARLYVFAQAGTSRSPGVRARVLGKARGLANAGVVLREPVGSDELAEELRQSRVFLHGGEPREMFGMETAEAQAMGVPAVVCDVTCLRERVIDAETGFVVPDRDARAFAAAALRVLGDDALWRAQRDAALRYNRARGWDDVAADFEELRR